MQLAEYNKKTIFLKKLLTLKKQAYDSCSMNESIVHKALCLLSLLLVIAASFGGIGHCCGDTLQDLQNIRDITDSFDQAKAYSNWFEGFKTSVQEQWKEILGDGDDAVYPINGCGKGGKCSPICLSEWALGNILPGAGLYWQFYIPADKREEILSCCASSYRCYQACCGCGHLAWFFNILSCGVPAIVAFIDDGDVYDCFMKSEGPTVQKFICEQLEVRNIKQASERLNTDFCEPVSNLLVSMCLKEDITWDVESMDVLLNLYSSYEHCDNNGHQINFDETIGALYVLLARLICNSTKNSQELNGWLIDNLVKSFFSKYCMYSLQRSLLMDSIHALLLKSDVQPDLNMQAAIGLSMEKLQKEQNQYKPGKIEERYNKLAARLMVRN